MVRITLLDGSTQEISRTELRQLRPFRALLTNPRLKSAGVLYEGGRLYPVHGPLPSEAELTGGARPWLLFSTDSVRVIRDLPTFDDELELNIVPAVKAPPAAATVNAAPALPEAEAFAAPEAVAAPLPFVARSEEEEEQQLMQELEDLLKAA